MSNDDWIRLGLELDARWRDYHDAARQDMADVLLALVCLLVIVGVVGWWTGDRRHRALVARIQAIERLLSNVSIHTPRK